MSIRTITSPEGAQYLKDIPELTTLPKNCLFDKALTGCGGTYLALTDPEPYVKSEQILEGEPQPLSRVSQKAPVLSPEDSPLFGVKVTSLKEICEIYDEDPARCFNEHYEWFLVFEELGTSVCKSYKYDKNKVKSLYDRAIQEKSPDLQAAVTRFFKVGSTYSAKDIKQTLKGMGLENAKGTSLAKWFHTKRVNSNGVMSYRILGRITDNL